MARGCRYCRGWCPSKRRDDAVAWMSKLTRIKSLSQKKPPPSSSSFECCSTTRRPSSSHSGERASKVTADEMRENTHLSHMTTIGGESINDIHNGRHSRTECRNHMRGNARRSPTPFSFILIFSFFFLTSRNIFQNMFDEHSKNKNKGLLLDETCRARARASSRWRAIAYETHFKFSAHILPRL